MSDNGFLVQHLVADSGDVIAVIIEIANNDRVIDFYAGDQQLKLSQRNCLELQKIMEICQMKSDDEFFTLQRVVNEVNDRIAAGEITSDDGGKIIHESTGFPVVKNDE